MPGLFIGTSGWSYPSWKPGFYPAGIPATRFLNFYATRLTAVEVNATFTKLPTPEQLQHWLDQTPAGFQFCFKAPRRITHFARLRDCTSHLEELFSTLEPARKAQKLGAILFQLPPNFRYTAETFSHLEAFLALEVLSSRRSRLAFEFRNSSWFEDPVYQLLRQHKAALCIADTDSLLTPAIETAPFHYYRLRRDGGYSAEEIKSLATHHSSLASDKAPSFVFFRHQEEPTGALNALAFQQALAGTA